MDFVPCLGRTLGVKETCGPDGLCEYCKEIVRQRVEIARLSDAVREEYCSKEWCDLMERNAEGMQAEIDRLTSDKRKQEAEIEFLRSTASASEPATTVANKVTNPVTVTISGKDPAEVRAHMFRLFDFRA